MKKTEKHISVLEEALKINYRLRISDAMQLLDVSESTARRLFRQMEEEGGVIRVHGGIQPAGIPAGEYRYDLVENRHTREKQAIATAAAALVEEGDVIFLDSGTTLGLMSRLVARRISQGSLGKITVFTNSLVNLHALSKTTQVTLIGGRYRDNRKDFCGYVAEETIKTFHFNKCFLGADGYSIRNGFGAMDFSTARMSELVLGLSDVCVILADASKFEEAAMVGYSKNHPIHRLITDCMPDRPVLQALRGAGTQITVAETASPDGAEPM